MDDTPRESVLKDQYQEGMTTLGNFMIGLGVLFLLFGLARTAVEAPTVLLPFAVSVALFVGVGVGLRRMHLWANGAAAVLAGGLTLLYFIRLNGEAPSESNTSIGTCFFLFLMGGILCGVFCNQLAYYRWRQEP